MPSQPGKEFEIQKRLDRLRGIKRFNNNKNNNNNKSNDGGNLFPPGPGGDLFPPRPVPGQGPGLPPLPPSINDFIPPRVPEDYEIQQILNQLRGTSTYSPPPFFGNNAPTFHIPAQTSSFTRRSARASGNLYGSQTATLEENCRIFD